MRNKQRWSLFKIYKASCFFIKTTRVVWERVDEYRQTAALNCGLIKQSLFSQFRSTPSHITHAHIFLFRHLRVPIRKQQKHGCTRLRSLLILLAFSEWRLDFLKVHSNYSWFRRSRLPSREISTQEKNYFLIISRLVASLSEGVLVIIMTFKFKLNNLFILSFSSSIIKNI